MAKGQKNWTPDEIRNKTAKKWQGILYATGLFSGLIAWASFDDNSDGIGIKFTLATIVLFALGSLIKTTWVKRGQVNVYFKDKGREALRWKFYGAGMICGLIAGFALTNGVQELGGFFAIVGTLALLIGGLMPTKWVKRAEGGVYK